MGGRNTPTSFISGAEWLLQFATLVSEGLRARGWNNEKIHALATDNENEMLDRGVDAFVNEIDGPIKVSEFLKPLFTTAIESTGGEECIGQATDVFSGYIDPNFQYWGLNVAGEAKSAQPVVVHKLVKDGRFKQFFTSLATDLDSLYLTQTQIVVFCRKHKNLLRHDGYATFFLFKKRNEYFVAGVHGVSLGELGVSVGRFSDADRRWNGVDDRRIIVPFTCRRQAT